MRNRRPNGKLREKNIDSGNFDEIRGVRLERSVCTPQCLGVTADNKKHITSSASCCLRQKVENLNPQDFLNEHVLV